MISSNRFEHISAGIKADLEGWNSDLKKNSLHEHFHVLRRTNFILGILNFSLDWLIICISIYIGITVPFLFVICLLVVGSRQRGLSNLIHDSSHWNLTRNKKINDIVADIFGGFVMLSPVKLYRKSHLLHHKYLGHPELDPDLKMHSRYEYDDSGPPYTKWYKNVLHLLFNFNSWSDSNIGSLGEMNLRQKVLCILWWVTVFCIISALITVKWAVLGMGFWQLARATTYHAIRTIAEFLDHSGLAVGSITKSSRMIKYPNPILKGLLHPHNDNFHALHHFDPTIPQYNLAIAQNYIVEQSTQFRKIRKNDSYFVGAEAAIKDLVGAS